MIEDDVRLGQVVEILDEFTVVVNRGGNDGVRLGDRFLIYALGPELKDPETGGSLGKLEVVRGAARAVHVQERMATIKSDDYDNVPPRTIKRTAAISIFSDEVVEGSRRERVPLRQPMMGDLVKHVGRP